MSRSFQFRDRTRMFWVLASVSALIIASLGAAFYSEARYQAQTVQAANVQAQILAGTVTAALSFGDRAALGEYVGALKANSEVDAVGVYDDQGRLVASFARSHLDDRLTEVKDTP